MKEVGKTILKGFCVGGSMLVPGVSGGSMAMILGVYDRLIGAVASFFEAPRENAAFLGLFCLGGLLGLALLARPLWQLIEVYPRPLLYFFIGAAWGSVPMIFRQAGVQRLDWRALIYPVIGICIVGLLDALPASAQGSGLFDGGQAAVKLFVAGLAAAVALVLPGISVSYLLLVLGLYDQVLLAVSRLQIGRLLPLALGGLLGIILTTRLLEGMMRRYPRATYLTILGFLLGSAVSIFPGLPRGLEIILCPLLFGAGFGLIWKLSALS